MSTESTASTSLHAPLDEYVLQFEDLARDARRLTDGLSHRQFNWSPAPGRWSIAHCLDHLNRVAEGYKEALAEGIEEAGHRGLLLRGPVRYGWLERWLIRSMEPPPRFRMPAPRRFRSAEADEHELAEVVGDFAALKRRLIDLAFSADGLDLGRAKITSPESRLLRLRIGAAFAFVASHERRHLWQARRVREDPRFPQD